MRLIFSQIAWEDYRYWQTADRTVLKRVNRLIEDILRDPFDGIGKPEPLKHNLSGLWSRRIDEEHRLIYRVYDDDVEIASVRYHYGK